MAVGLSLSMTLIVGSGWAAGANPPEDPAVLEDLQQHAAKGADQILGIRAEDQPQATVLEITGNGPFQDVRVHKLGARRLAVDLSGVTARAAQAAVPTPSRWIKKVHVDGSASDKVRVVVDFHSAVGEYRAEQPGSMVVLSATPAARQAPIADAPQLIAERKVAAELPDNLPAAPPAPPVASAALADKTVALDPAPARQAVAPPAPVATTFPAAAFQPVAAPARTPGKREFDPMAALHKNYTGKPISLDLQEAEIKNVLRLLSDVSGSNIVIEPDVDGKVTLKVNRVPWDQILDMILTMNNLGKEQVGGVIRIARQEKLKKEFQERDSEIRARQQFLEASKEVGDLTTHYLQVNYAKSSDIAAKIANTKSPKGKVTVDERTNVILYTDYPGYVQAARDLMAKLDMPTPQVLIEARIVQLATNASRELGIEWSWNYEYTDSNGAHLYAGDFEINHPVARTGALGSSLFGFSIGQIAGQTLWNIDMRISALESAGKGRIVSAPKVLTLDNVEATIVQGQQIPYLKLNEFGVATTEFKDAALELKVVPHITPDQKVSLKVDAKKEQPDFARSVNGVPAIDTRRVSTVLLVPDGDTIVIGGVIEETDTRLENRTPYLANVPVLGALFKSERMRREKSELLIFISPRIAGQTFPATARREPLNQFSGGLGLQRP
jgi:type IV pilus assembly protein PilQ